MYLKNFGIAFSLLSNEKKEIQYFFIIIGLLIIIKLSNIVKKIPNNQKLLKNSYSLIIGGAIGNIIDRISYGFVVDFIDIYICEWHFSTFNIADFSISCGCLLILYKIFFHSLK